MRLSITLDVETMDLIDKFAKEHGIDRNRAILEFIESGYEKLSEGGIINLNQQRAFEEYREIKQNIEDMKKKMEDLIEEVRLIHHTIDVEWGHEMRAVPYQSKKMWEFWKTK
ncbi:MAG TPA: type II secretion system protein E [Methanoregulaceae archaeon]|nr:type II secretion system protein E [Methanoregulaceae archaeon]